MRKRKKLWIILAIPVIAIAVFAAFFLPDSNCDLTVSATFQAPRQDGGIGLTTIHPRQEAEWSREYHGAPFEPVRIAGGKLNCSAGYGPMEFKGAFSCGDILRAWPEAPVDKDWGFHISLFDCHTEGHGYRMYCNVQVDAGTGLSTADLYIFSNGSANPETARWEGTIGEEIILRTDF